jgi:large subunit ribosomal protein L7Ae
MGVPYFIIKGKARLGRLVHKKTCTAVAAVAVTQVLWLTWWKLLGRTKYKDRQDQPPLCPKSVARIAKLKLQLA